MPLDRFSDSSLSEQDSEDETTRAGRSGGNEEEDLLDEDFSEQSSVTSLRSNAGNSRSSRKKASKRHANSKGSNSQRKDKHNRHNRDQNSVNSDSDGNSNNNNNKNGNNNKHGGGWSVWSVSEQIMHSLGASLIGFWLAYYGYLMYKLWPESSSFLECVTLCYAASMLQIDALYKSVFETLLFGTGVFTLTDPQWVLVYQSDLHSDTDRFPFRLRRGPIQTHNHNNNNNGDSSLNNNNNHYGSSSSSSSSVPLLLPIEEHSDLAFTAEDPILPSQKMDSYFEERRRWLAPHITIDDNLTKSERLIVYDDFGRSFGFSRVQPSFSHGLRDTLHYASLEIDSGSSNGLSFSTVLSYRQSMKEFHSEMEHCRNMSMPHLNRNRDQLSKGFHLLCVHYFPFYSQSLIVAYQHGSGHDKIPPLRQTRPSNIHLATDHILCRTASSSSDTSNITRVVSPSYIAADQWRSGDVCIEHYTGRMSECLSLSRNIFSSFSGCHSMRTGIRRNPKVFLVQWRSSLRQLRLHLQLHLIDDISRFDHYTRLAFDYRNRAIPGISAAQPLSPHWPSHLPMKAPKSSLRTVRLPPQSGSKRHRMKAQRNGGGSRSKSSSSSNGGSNNSMGGTEYRRNPWALFTPKGRTAQPSELSNAATEGRILYLMEGGRWVWPGVERNHRKHISMNHDGSKMVTLRTLNMRPLLFEVSGLLSEGDCDRLIEKAEPRLSRSEVGLSSEKTTSEARTCFGTWLNSKEEVLVDSMKQRVSQIVQMPVTFMEDLEILRYHQGQKFDPHFDAFDFMNMMRQSMVNDSRNNNQNNNNNGRGNGNGNGNGGGAASDTIDVLHKGRKNRIATMFYYLSYADANTVFPSHDRNRQFYHYLGDESLQRIGDRNAWFQRGCQNDPHSLFVRPRKGKAFLLYNLLPNGDIDMSSMHGACNVTNDRVKWAANHWIWNRSFK